MGNATPAAQMVAALAGGLISSGTHLAKSSGRVAINTSPEPFSNWMTSAGEDGLVLVGLFLAIRHPAAFLVLLALFLLLLIWLLPKLIRFVVRLARRLRGGIRAATVAQK
jgi:CBS domain containing-hemolysin-like protein